MMQRGTKVNTGVQHPKHLSNTVGIAVERSKRYGTIGVFAAWGKYKTECVLYFDESSLELIEEPTEL